MGGLRLERQVQQLCNQCMRDAPLRDELCPHQAGPTGRILFEDCVRQFAQLPGKHIACQVPVACERLDCRGKFAQLRLQIRARGGAPIVGYPDRLADPVAEHRQELVGCRAQRVAHEAGGLEPPYGRLDAVAHRGFAVRAAQRILPDDSFVACVGALHPYTELDQIVELVQEFAHLSRRIAQRHRPQPFLQARCLAMGLRQQLAPTIQCGFAKGGLRKLARVRGFDVPDGLHDQFPQGAIARQQDPVFVEPAFEFVQQTITILPARELGFEPAHHVAALVFGHGAEAERLVRAGLIFDQRVGMAVVQRRHRPEIGRFDAELLPQVLPEIT